MKYMYKLSIRKHVSRNTSHYRIHVIELLVLNVLLYFIEAKKRCKKTSLNKLSLAADLLKKTHYILNKRLSRTPLPHIERLLKWTLDGTLL